MDDIDNLLNGDDINDIPLDLDINFGASALAMQEVEEDDDEEDDDDDFAGKWLENVLNAENTSVPHSSHGEPGTADAAINEVEEEFDIIGNSEAINLNLQLQEKASNLLSTVFKLQELQNQVMAPVAKRHPLENPSPSKKYERIAYKHLFRDDDGFGPSNPDIVTRNQLMNASYDPWVLPALRFTPKHQKALAEGVKEDAVKKFTTPLISHLEHLQASYESSEKAEILEKINQIKSKLNNVPRVEDLIANRFQEFDWNAIANIHLNKAHSAIACKLFWQNRLHPSINKESKFSPKDVENLHEAITKSPDLNWVKISKEVPGRTALDCCRYYNRYMRRKQPWTPEEDRLLTSLVERYRVKNVIPYNQIACHIPGRCSSQLVHRWTKSLDPAIRRDKWDANEDANLIRAVVQYGQQWAKIRDMNILPGRNDAQIRERYVNCLMDRARGPFTKEEDEMIMSLVKEQGGFSWSKVAKSLPGRNDNQVSKRYKLLTQNKIRNRKSNNNWSKEGHAIHMQSIQNIRNQLCTVISIEEKNKQIGAPVSSQNALSPPENKKQKVMPWESRNVIIDDPSIISKMPEGIDSEGMINFYHNFTCNRTKKKKTRSRKKVFTVSGIQYRNEILGLIGSKLRNVRRLTFDVGHPANLYMQKIAEEWKSEITNQSKTWFMKLVQDLNIDTEAAFTVLKRKKNLKLIAESTDSDEVRKLELELPKLTLSNMERSFYFVREKSIAPFPPTADTVQMYSRIVKNKKLKNTMENPVEETKDYEEKLKLLKKDERFKRFSSRFNALTTFPAIMEFLSPYVTDKNRKLRSVLNKKQLKHETLFVESIINKNKNR